MKIIVQEANGKAMRIVLPTGLALNRLTAMILPDVLEKKGITLTREQCLRIIQAIRACRRCYPGWKLVEVESKEGEYVEVSL